MKPWLALLIGILLISACGKEESYSDNDQKPSAQPQRQSAEVVIERLDDAGLRKLITQRHAKWLLLNVWATWCLPCREEFPDLVRLAESYRNSNVEFIGLSVDYPDEIETKIIPFLRSIRVNFKIYVQDFNDPSDLIRLLNPNWNGALPATFIFDTHGNFRQMLLGAQSYESFKEAIEKHLRIQ